MARPRILPHPEETDSTLVMDKLEQLVANSCPGTRIDPRSLAKDCKEAADAMAVALSLNEMVESGRLAAVYKVTSQQGEMTEDEFQDPTQIPDTLLSSGTRDIVPLFVVR